MSILKALSLLATESWDTDKPEDRDHWRVLASKAREELDELRAQLVQAKFDGAASTAAYEAMVKALAERNAEVERLRAENERLTNDDYKRRMETGE